MSGIFSQLAPTYTGRGLEPRPVKPGEKACKVTGWRKPDSLIDSDVRSSWLTKYGDYGIGLRLGTLLPDDTRLGALDIDRDDSVRLARALLGDRCERIGSKGTAIFFRYVGSLKPTKLKRKSHEGADTPVGDLLVDGSFCVIPPTVHPGTGRPYYWTGRPLHEVDAQSLPLVASRPALLRPSDDAVLSLELLIAALTSEHLAPLADGASTHDAALRYVAELLPHTQDPEVITGLVRAALPEDYRGNTLREVPEMVASGLSKGLHQPNGSSLEEYDPGDAGPIPFGYLPNGDFVLFDQRKRIIVPQSSNGLVALGTLLSFAPLTFWAARFPTAKGGINTIAAGDAIMKACRRRGGFDPGLVRGRGVFPDPVGGYVVNWGGEVPRDTTHVYVCYRSLDLTRGTAEADPHAILTLFERFNWADKSSALLLLGWAASSVICGALRWRPHVFVTGAKNTGKTTLVRALQRLLDPVAIVLDGQSSEAGIRQKVGPDSRPVILDEFESDLNTMRMRQVIKLMRSASSAESSVARGTPEGKALEFAVRSSFLLAAINPMGVTAADRSRIVVMPLGKHENERATAEAIQQEVSALQGAGPSWCRLLLGKVETILANIATLERVFPACDSRHAANMATLLGAAQAVLLDHPMLEQEARALIDAHHGVMDQLAEAHEEDDSVNCLNALLEYSVRTDDGTAMVGSLLARIKAAEASPKDRELAISSAMHVLGRLGIRWENSGFLIANSHRGLSQIFEGTVWEAGTWGPSLKRLEGACTIKQRRFEGQRSEATWIPAKWIPDHEMLTEDF